MQPKCSNGAQDEAVPGEACAGVRTRAHQDEKGGAQTARCLFCIYDRRDKVEVGSSTGRKRKSRVDIKYYTKPFAPQNYRSHNTTQHGKAWAEYSELCNAKKREYFTGKTKIVNTLHHYLDVEGDTMEFKVSPPIV